MAKYKIRIRKKNPGLKGKIVGELGPFPTQAAAAAKAQVLADAHVYSQAHQILVEAMNTPKRRSPVGRSKAGARMSNPGKGKKLGHAKKHSGIGPRKSGKRGAILSNPAKIVWTKLKDGSYSGKIGGKLTCKIVPLLTKSCKKSGWTYKHKAGKTWRKVSNHFTVALAKKAAAAKHGAKSTGKKLVGWYTKNPAKKKGTSRVRTGAISNPGKGDKIAARELELFISNEGGLFGSRSRAQSVRKNLLNKMAAGKYNKTLAIKAWGYVASDGAKQYNKEFGSGYTLAGFDKATRDIVAKSFAEDFHAEAKMGHFDYLLLKKYQKNPWAQSVASTGRRTAGKVAPSRGVRQYKRS